MSCDCECSSSHETKMPKICIDPGHGMGNRHYGKHDPGCEHGGYQEAELVMPWAQSLRNELQALGAQVMMTRENQKDPCPLSWRAHKAREEKCDILISIHVNDADTSAANGCEVQYNEHKAFAEKLQACLLEGMGLANHTNDYRPELAVLRFPGKCALIELGFIKNERDRRAITDSSIIQKTCKLLAQAILS